jgi:protein-ribulosamine 3-kinase
MSSSDILLKHLTRLEPDAEFTRTSYGYKSSTGASYFAKVGSISEREQYVGEAESLKVMNVAAPGLVPKLFAFGIDDDKGRPYFISEYKDMVSLSEQAAGVLGKRLASEMHQFKSTRGFGFDVPTFCGATRLANGWSKTWEECFDKLIAGLLEKLRSRGGYEELVAKAEQVRSKSVNSMEGRFRWCSYAALMLGSSQDS